MRRSLVGLVAAATLLTASACSSDASTVSKNISTEAEQFKVVRKIVITNMVDNSVLWEVTGLCSLDIGNPGILVLTCREGPDQYKKHYLGTAGMYLSWAATQVDAADISRYHTTLVFRPTSVIPNIDIAVGQK